MSYEKGYYVKSFDSDGITLKQNVLSFNTIRVPRHSIASVRKTLSTLHVETTGGKVYQVMRGLRKAQEKLTEEAFEGLV